MNVKLDLPELGKQTPKTITVIGRFSNNLSLTKIFDVIPLFETEEFKILAFKHEGLLRECSDGGIVKQSDTEFKNSITVEILDKVCNKIRSIKIHCAGIHMCGNRSLQRAREMANLVTKMIVDTNDFITYASSKDISWENDIETHPFYPTMLPTIHSILPNNATLTEDMKERVRGFFRGVVECGGLYEKDNREELTLLNLDTVMINFSYNIEEYLRTYFKSSTKEMFLKKFIETVQERPDLTREFDIVMIYDSLSSSMGWSGAVPLKFIHVPSGAVQWLTIQMRRGTIVNSGPSFEIMQKAVDILYSLLTAVAQAVIL
jgi:hypothetical protein